MTVQANDRRRTYLGNGVTTIFNGPMSYETAWVLAYLVDNVTGAVAPVLAADYNVTGLGRKNGTTVTMNVAPPAGKTLLLLRTLPYSQDVDVTNQGAFLPETLEKAYDVEVMQIQQLDDSTMQFGFDAGAFVWDARGYRISNVAPGTSALDAVNVSQLAAVIAGVVHDGGLLSFLEFGADPTGVADCATAFQLAAASGRSVFGPPGAIFRMATTPVFSLNRQRFYGFGSCRIQVDGAIGMDVTSMVSSGIEGFTFVGAGAADGKVGLRIADHDASFIERNEFKALQVGCRSLAKAREPWYAGNNYVPSAIQHNQMLNCGTGIELLDKAEYVSVNGNIAFGCTRAGIYSEAGNCPILNNNITACEIGIWQKGNAVGGSLDNPDHNTIGFNTTNHCKAAGILLDGVSVSTSMVGNESWATDPAGTSDPASPMFAYGKGYGVFYKNTRRLISRGNVYMNSTYNAGFDGWADSSADDLIEHTDLAITSYYRCEGNGAFGDNRNITLRLGNTNSASVQDVIANATAGVNRLFRIVANPLVQGVTLDNTVVVDYKHDGRHDEIVVLNNYANQIVVPSYAKGTSKCLNVLGCTALPGKAWVFPAGATITSGTPWATVSGNVAYLRGELGRFTATATTNQNSWNITYEGRGVSACTYAVGTGTTYLLTTTVAAVDFGTTDPAVVLPGPGTYVITGTLQVDAVAATVGTTQNLDLRIRRTNNTPADIDQAIIDLSPLTAQTLTVGLYNLRAVYVTANNDDAVTLFAGLSAALAAGTMRVVKANIQAEIVH